MLQITRVFNPYTTNDPLFHRAELTIVKSPAKISLRAPPGVLFPVIINVRQIKYFNGDINEIY